MYHIMLYYDEIYHTLHERKSRENAVIAKAEAVKTAKNNRIM